MTFTVEYADDTAVDVSSLDSSDIRVTGPNNFSQLVAFLSATPGGNGTPRTATYQINAPGDSWDAADNGTYTLQLAESQVLDTSGNAATAVNLGNFNVSAPALDAEVTLAVSPEGAIEDSDSTIAYTFTRTDSINSPLSQPLTVSFSVGGTASFGNDYTQSGATAFSATTGTVAFAANSVTAAVTLTLVADTANEPNETVELTLAAGSGYTSGTAGAVTAAITNDDTPPTYNFSAATFNVPEGNAANTANVLTVTRSGDTSTDSSVDVVLAAGAVNPAAIGSNVQAGPITVNFAAGETSKTVPIQVLGDVNYEPDETVALSFANFTNEGVAGTANPTAESYHGNTVSAINRNGSLIAMELYNGISVMDRNFNAVENLAGVNGGLAFDPTRDILYAANSVADELIAYDTNTWDVLYRRSIGENINASSPFVSGGMSVSDNGQYLFLSTPAGVRMFNLTGTGLPESHKVNVGFGQIEQGMNFGNAI